MTNKTAVIIGSGIAGMAAAIRLAVKGYTVNVYEKNSYPGGKLSSFEQDGYHFDAGPSLFTQPQNIEELFTLAGERMEDHFQYRPVDIACRYFYENGKIINAYTDPDKFAEELKRQVNEDPQAVIKYLKKSKRLYENVGTVFINNPLHKRNTWLNKSIGKAMMTVRLPYLYNTLQEYNNKHFSRPETVQLFNRFATYNGSNPYKAPAMLSLIPHLEQNEGVFFPAGGMISITNAVYSLAKAKGVRFHFDAPVQRIIYHEGTVRGVVVEDKNILSSIVVSNADVYLTYNYLLGNTGKAKRIIKQERSSSAVVFYWGIKKQFPQLFLHNLFFSSDYKKEFSGIFVKNQISDDPTVYINITSKMETTQAPERCENWFVMVNVPSNTGQDWEQLTAVLRKNVLTKLSRVLGENIEQLIETEHTTDPVKIGEQSGSFMGSIYGSSSNSRMSAFLRHANYSNNIKGLYFCGGTVHPGGGIPLCLKSAKITSDLISEDKQ